MKSKFILLNLIVALTIGNINSQTNDSVLFNKNEILNWLKEYNVPAVGIGKIENGELSYCEVFGELRENIPAHNSTIFTIASITKTITAIVTLELVESGQWDLDSPLSKYWIDPDVVGDERHKKITTRHVLSHQSGLPNWRNDLDSKKLAFLFNPGEKYFYSGEGFEYLKKALENKFQKSLEELSDSILFKPLGMSNTKFKWDNETEKSGFAYRHDSEGKEYKYQGCTKASAASGLLTTVEDYAKFCIHVLNHAGLSESLYNEMILTHKNIKKNYDQGLGWQLIKNLPNGEYALLHQGGEWGVVTITVILPKSKRGLIVFTNGDQGDEIYSKLLKKYLDVGDFIIDVFNGMSYDPEQIKIMDVPVEILSTYVGSYYVESFQMTLKIKLEDSILKLESPYSTMVLHAETETKFFLKVDDLKIEFVKDKNDKITGIILTYKGGKPEFSKKGIYRKFLLVPALNPQ